MHHEANKRFSGWPQLPLPHRNFPLWHTLIDLQAQKKKYQPRQPEPHTPSPLTWPLSAAGEKSVHIVWIYSTAFGGLHHRFWRLRRSPSAHLSSLRRGGIE